MKRVRVVSMKRVLAAVLVVLLTSGLLLGCGGAVKGSGKLKTEEYGFGGFDQVDISSAFEFEIAQAHAYHIAITADDNLFDHIQVSQEGATLRILLKTAQFGGITTKAYVFMPKLHGLNIYGSASGTISGFSSTDKLNIKVSEESSLELVEMSAGNVKFEVSGDSKVTGDLVAGNTDFDIAGASTVQLEGSAQDIVVDADGLNRVKLAGFAVINADVNLKGASTGTINLSGTLDVDLEGDSKLEYIGTPEMGTINTSGGSILSEKGSTLSEKE